MEIQKAYQQINRQLERLVFLFLADEGVYGLYEFILELDFKFLTIADKYAIAVDLLTELLIEKLIVLEEFTDHDFSQKTKDIATKNIEFVLNQPSSWYPSGKPVYSVSITEKGLQCLAKVDHLELEAIKSRLFSNSKRIPG